MRRPLLPQDDSSPRRQLELAEQRAVYKWTHQAFEGIASCEGIPKGEGPPVTWLARVAELILESVRNADKIERDEERIEGNRQALKELREDIEDFEKGGMHAAFEHIASFVQGEEFQHIPVKDIADYDLLFQSIKRPELADTYQSNRSFARLRLAGPNPMEMKRITALPAHFPVTPFHFEQAMAALACEGEDNTPDTLADALSEGRAFLCDYKALDGLPGGDFPRGPKYICAPLGLFVSTKGTRTLLPVAIQCAQAVGPKNPIFTPGDGLAWQMARSALQTADTNMHQAVRHLAHTHLVMEPFHVAAKRSLAPQHPIARLLEPHFQGTVYINNAANTKLMAPKGGVDAVLALPIGVSRQAAVSGVQTWNFRGSMIERDLHERGLMDRDTLPDFPYRDDGLLIWHALHDWVEAVVRTYYEGDASVVADIELQEFVATVQAPEGGRISGLGAVRTVPDLIQVLTHIIFTASTQHAAVNFPQRDQMAYMPAFPLSNFAPPPTSTQVTQEQVLEQLPAMDLAHYQATLGHLLGGVHHGALGQYRERWFGHFAGDRRLNTALDGLQSRLEQIEALITERNERRMPYTYLLPSNIPQSINI